MEGLFIVRIFKSYNISMLTSPSKVVWLVAVAYLTTFFALASGLINALIEGRGINRFMIPSRSAQTIGDSSLYTDSLHGNGRDLYALLFGKVRKPKGRRRC